MFCKMVLILLVIILVWKSELSIELLLIFGGII